ncbi:MAG: hypothetical protein GX649_01875 [Chloroflexi bacterium]|nr:hypothetical protein [Chloroflexota bacterium]
MRHAMRILLIAALLATLSACAPPSDGRGATLGETAGPGTTEPVTHVIAGDDWGYPSPFAFYNRGPGYVTMSLLFDTLVWKDAEGYIPWLATDWTASDDGLAWTFALRDGVSWHDGTPLTAEDVAFSYTYMAARNDDGMLTWGYPLDRVAGATASEDGRTVTIRIAEPTAGLLLDLFGALPIIPRHIWEGVEDPVRKLDEEAVVGSGMFRLREYSREEGRYVFEANPVFFLGKASVDLLVYVRTTDPAVALLSGEVDEASFSGKAIASVEHLRETPGLQVLEGPSDWTLKLYMNTTREPLNVREVRQAIAYSVDRQDIVEKAQLGGAVVASTGILSPGTSWHHPDLPTYAHDPARARALLEEAGAAPFATTLVTTEQYVRDAELIRAYLEEIGIDATVRTADRATVDNLLNEGGFDLLITGHGGGANPDMDAPSPPAAWVSGEYAAVYAASRAAIDDAERREQVWRLQEIVAEELPVLALWHPQMWEVYRPGVARPLYTPGGIAGGIPLATNKLMFLPQ